MKKIISLILFFTLLVISGPSYADYKIVLKNGREFVVEEYKESGGKIKFYKGGGEIEIDKNSIKDIKKVKAPKTTEETDYSGIIRYDQTEKQAPEGKENEAKAKSAAAESRLKEIAKKKTEMREEEEKLKAEGKKLEEDIRKEGKTISIRKKREIEHQYSELSTKIKNFNEELSKLEQEEEQLLKERGVQQKKQ